MISRINAALAARLKGLKEGDKGFTLIELLVVVIIIGILAAIAIPIYIGVQNNAKDAAAQSDLTNAKTAVVAYYTKNNAFPAVNAATLGAFGYSQSTVDSVALVGVGTIAAFCLEVDSDSGATFHIDEAVGATAGVC